MGTLVTLQLPPGSPIADLPWVVTIGALGGDDEDDWDPVVCGPYERGHALALARAVVADDDLMAVVEPLQLLDGVEAIRKEVDLARSADFGDEISGPAVPDAADVSSGHAGSGAGGAAEAGSVPDRAPEPDEVRAGWCRIAGRLTR